MKTVGILLLCAVAVWGQIPPPCEAPKEWTARRISTEPGKDFEIRMRYYYDEPNLRKRHLEEVIDGDKRDYYDNFFFHKEKVQYRMDLHTHKCTKSDLAEPFHYYGIGVNDTFEGEFYLGSGADWGMGVLVQLWRGKSPEGNTEYQQFTVHDCLPVERVFVNATEGVFKENFYDIYMGLRPSDFELPRECQSAVPVR